MIENIRGLNTNVLKKQYLAADVESSEITDVVERITALHATIASKAYISLFARMKDFKKEELGRAIYERKEPGKLRCMRRTMHIVTKEMLPYAYAATKSLIAPRHDGYLKHLSMKPEQYDQISGRIVELLKGKNLSIREIKDELDSKLSISAAVNLMCDEGLLIRNAPKGGWKSGTHAYSLFSDYFPDIELDSIDELVAREKIVESYIKSLDEITEEAKRTGRFIADADVKVIKSEVMIPLTEQKYGKYISPLS